VADTVAEVAGPIAQVASLRDSGDLAADPPDLAHALPAQRSSYKSCSYAAW
jgi:hypothetical protein